MQRLRPHTSQFDRVTVDAALEEARDRLEGAASYRFWWSIAGSGPAAVELATGEPLIVTGTVVGTDGMQSSAWSVTSPAEYPGRTIRYVVIGGQVWCDSGVGLWTVFEGGQAELALADAEYLAPPGAFADTFLDRAVELLPAGWERVGGIEALRLEAADASQLPLPGWWLGMDGELQSFVLWLTAAGEPLQAEAAGVVHAGTEAGAFRMLMQVSALDDPANRVEPPI